MQRDNYAAIIRKWRYKRPILPIPIRFSDGKIRIENVFDESFEGFSNRRIVLTTLTGKQQVILDMPSLIRCHRPGTLYSLSPLLCENAEVLSVLQGVCDTPGAPFSLSHRLYAKTLSYRFQEGSQRRGEICQFFDRYLLPSESRLSPAARTLPIRGISFDGLLARKEIVPVQSFKEEAAPSYRAISAAAYIHLADYVTDAKLQETQLIRDFFHSPLNAKLSNNTALHQYIFSLREHHHILATRFPVGSTLNARSTPTPNSTLRKALLGMAKEKNILLYERHSDGQYRFAY